MFIPRRRPTGLLSATTARRAAVSSTVGSVLAAEAEGDSLEVGSARGCPWGGAHGVGRGSGAASFQFFVQSRDSPPPSRLLCNAPPQNPLRWLQFSGPPHSSRQKSLLYWSGDADSWGTLRPLDSFSISQHCRPEG